MDKVKLAELEKIASDYAKIYNRRAEICSSELSVVRDAINEVHERTANQLLFALMESFGYELLRDGGVSLWKK